MHEATVLAVIGLLYSGFISFTSMAISMFFGKRDLLVVGHVIVLIVFLGGGKPESSFERHISSPTRSTVADMGRRYVRPLTRQQALVSSPGSSSVSGILW